MICKVLHRVLGDGFWKTYDQYHEYQVLIGVFYRFGQCFNFIKLELNTESGTLFGTVRHVIIHTFPVANQQSNFYILYNV